MTTKNQAGDALADGHRKLTKKPYEAPSFRVLDPAAAKAKLDAAGAWNGAKARQTLPAVHELADGKKVATISAPQNRLR